MNHPSVLLIHLTGKKIHRSVTSQHSHKGLTAEKAYFDQGNEDYIHFTKHDTARYLGLVELQHKLGFQALAR